LKIITAYKSGGLYNESHIERLAKQVKEFSGIELTPIYGELDHWWCKIDLFRIEGPCLYFDLDTTIVDDLEPLLEIAEKYRFVTLENWNQKGGVASGVMSWSGDMLHLYENFKPSMINRYPARGVMSGDQAYIYENESPLFFDDLTPNMVQSYKAHVRRKGIHPDCRVIAFSGNPRPWAIDELVKE